MGLGFTRLVSPLSTQCLYTHCTPLLFEIVRFSMKFAILAISFLLACLCPFNTTPISAFITSAVFTCLLSFIDTAKTIVFIILLSSLKTLLLTVLLLIY